jgi:phenylacetate-CoA ligase
MGINDAAGRLAGKVPYSLQSHLRYAYHLVRPSYPYGSIFKETYDLLQRSQWWERDKLADYQLRQLNALLCHAYDNVPYYRRLFDERGLKPADIQDLEDLKKLPCLTKDAVREDFPELVALNARTALLPVVGTSGTMGKTLHFYSDDVVRQKELAFMFHQWSRVGYRPGERRVELRGALIQGKKPYEYDRTFKVLRLSPHIEGTDTARLYLERIESFGADYMSGYPCTISDLAYIIKKHGLAVPFRYKAIMLAMDKVYQWQRELIGEVFGCRVFSHYGMAERAAMAGECEHSESYHCCPQYGIVEIDPENGELICTGFLNRVNPFIRYRTGDVSSGVSERCELCGRAYYPVIEDVAGRLVDFVMTTRGQVGTSAFTYPFKKQRNIRESQIIQDDLTHVIVRVVPFDLEKGLHPRLELERLRRDLQRTLGDDMRIDIEQVESIERTEAGKFKWIVSDVAREMLEHGQD